MKIKILVASVLVSTAFPALAQVMDPLPGMDRARGSLVAGGSMDPLPGIDRARGSLVVGGSMDALSGLDGVSPIGMDREYGSAPVLPTSGDGWQERGYLHASLDIGFSQDDEGVAGLRRPWHSSVHRICERTNAHDVRLGVRRGSAGIL